MPFKALLRDQLAGLLGDGSHRDTRRTFFVHAFSLMGISLCVLFGIYHYWVGFEAMAAVDAVAAVGAGTNQLLLRRHRRVALAENVMLVLFFGFLLCCLWGNLDGTGAYWFLTFPLAAFFLKDLSTASRWTGAMTATLATLALLQYQGIIQTGYTARALTVLIAVMLTIALAVALYTAALNDAERRLAAKTLHLSREILERQSVEQTLRQAEEQLRFLAHHDHLTGLPTRALLYDRIDQALALARRNQGCLALLLLDYDRFALLNQRLGHETGDAVLQATAKRLRSVLREADTAARIGGNRFAVVLPEANETIAQAVADKLRAHLSRPYRTVQGDPTLELSLGQAVYPLDGDDRETLFSVAEKKLQREKLDHYAPRLVES